MNRRDTDPRRVDGEPTTARAVRSRDESVAPAPMGDDDVDADVDVRESPGDAARRSDVAARSDAPVTPDPSSRDASQQQQPLLASESLSAYQSRWERIQIGFVDEPRTAVRDAEALVNDTLEELTDVFARERQTLEKAWSDGTDASTEDMRVALQRYRSFFRRLLAM